ncbi:MAG: hypothetical protein AB8B55_08190 [Mariniblastus sp.]
MNSIASTRIFQLLSIVLVVGLVGCGGTDFGPIGSIAGKLSMDGKPLPAGSKVIFQDNISGHMGFGITLDDGSFGIEWRREGTIYDGLPVGSYQVMIIPAGAMDVDEMTADEMLDGGPAAPPKATIPAKYYRISSSGLEYDIVEGENAINIDIPSR